MSTTSASPPPSLQSNEDTTDSISSEFSTEAQPPNYEPPQKNIYKINSLTSHGVEDILSEGTTYTTENQFPECKAEVLSTLSSQVSFVQDYNSRDSTGFSIHDILGLQQSYNAVSTQESMLEPRYEYQIPQYDNISNSSNNNYGSGTEEVLSDHNITKSDDFFPSNESDIQNQNIYHTNYPETKPVRCQRGDLGNDVMNNTEEVNDISESSFPSQVKKNHNDYEPYFTKHTGCYSLIKARTLLTFV